MTLTSIMLQDRYKELDAELIAARQRVAELLAEYDEAHTQALVIKAANQVQFAKEYNRAAGSVEARKQTATELLEEWVNQEAVAKAKADVLREYLNAARDDVRCIMQQMTNAQSVGAFARAEMTL
jgi:exonuclease VII small subunit